MKVILYSLSHIDNNYYVLCCFIMYQVMQMIQPHIVFIELCKHRLGILQLDEERLLEESKNINYQKFQQSVQKVS